MKDIAKIKSVRTAEEITNKMYYITHPFARSILQNKIYAKCYES
jgi:hypothetical protein